MSDVTVAFVPGIGGKTGGARARKQRESEPLLSVIVVVFRDREELAALIENLSPFRGDDLEVVIIDGGSNDGSVELLEQNDERVDYWLSERDNGIYDAMNKGLKAARGRWVLHINAGDRLLSVPYEALRTMQEQVGILGAGVECPVDHFTFVARMNWTFRYQSTLHHQGTFFLRAKHCGYDSTYRVLGDVAATQRMVRQGTRVALLPDVVSMHIGGGLSDLPGNDQEWSRLIRENHGWVHVYIHSLLFMPARRAYRKLRKRLG